MDTRSLLQACVNADEQRAHLDALEAEGCTVLDEERWAAESARDEATEAARAHLAETRSAALVAPEVVTGLASDVLEIAPGSRVMVGVVLHVGHTTSATWEATVFSDALRCASGAGCAMVSFAREPSRDELLRVVRKHVARGVCMCSPCKTPEARAALTAEPVETSP